MENLTNTVYTTFQINEKGVSLVEMLQFKEVKDFKILKSEERSGYWNHVFDAQIQLEDGNMINWFVVEQGWSGFDDVDHWTYVFPTKQLALECYSEYSNL